MASQDENRSVNFNLTVDPTGVENGVNRAIKAFDRLEDSSNKAMESSKFEVTSSALNGYKRQISQIASEITKLTSTISKMSGEMRNSLNIDKAPLDNTVNGLKAVTMYLDNTKSVTVDSMKKINEVFSIVNQSIQGFTNHVKKLGSESETSSIKGIVPAIEKINIESVKTTQSLKVLTDSAKDNMGVFKILGDIVPKSINRVDSALLNAKESMKKSTKEIGDAWQRQLSNFAGESNYMSPTQILKQDLAQLNPVVVALQSQLLGLSVPLEVAANKAQQFKNILIDARERDLAIKLIDEKDTQRASEEFDSIINKLRESKSFLEDTETVTQRQKRTMKEYYDAVEDLKNAMANLGTTSVSALEDINNRVSATYRNFQNSTLETRRARDAIQEYNASLRDAAASADTMGKNVEAALAKHIAIQGVNDSLKGITTEFNNSRSALNSFKAASQGLSSPFDMATISTQRLRDAIADLREKTLLEKAAEEELKNNEDIYERRKRLTEEYSQAIAKLQAATKDLGSISVTELQKINEELQNIKSSLNEANKAVDDAEAATSEWAESMKGAGESVDTSSGIAALSSDPKIAAAIAVIKALKVAFEKIGSAVSKAKSKIDEFKDSITKLIHEGKDASGVVSELAKVAGFLGIGLSFEMAAESAMQYIENLNLFTVAMGDSIDVAQEFIDTMSEMYGLDPSNLMRYAGNFYQLTDAIDMASEASSIISLSLTKAAMDMSSLFNVDIETVVGNLSSGMQGMSRAVRKYGIDIRQTTLAQTGLNYGFQENISATSEANRQALRFLTIMHQIRNATQQQVKAFDEYTEEDFKELSDNFGLSMEEIRSAFDEALAGNKEAIYKLGVAGKAIMGDFARNIETPANQLRIIKEQISQLATAIGNLFIPMADALLFRINGLIMALRILITVITSLLGIDTKGLGGEISGFAEDIEDGLGGIGAAADSAKSKLDKLVAPFDELNILAENAGSNASNGIGAGNYGLDPALLEAIENMNMELDEIRMKAMDVRDAILEWFGIGWNENLKEFEAVEDGLVDNIQKAIENGNYRRVGELIAEKLNESIEWGIEQTDPQKVGPKIKEFFANLAQVINGLVDELNFEGLGTILGQLITDGLMGVDSFLENFEGDRLGEQVANFVTGVINAIEWDLLGKTIADAFNVQSAFEEALWSNFPWTSLGNSFGVAVNEFFEQTDWEQMGRAAGEKTNGIVKLIRGFFGTYKKGLISESIASKFNAEVKAIDFKKIAQTASNGIREFFKEIFNFSKNVDKGELAKSIFEFFANINWVGIIADLVEFLRQAILGLAIGVASAIAGVLISLVKGIINTVADIVLGILDFLYNAIKFVVDLIPGIEMDPSPFKDMAQEIHDTFWGTLGDEEAIQEEADKWSGNVKSKSTEGLEADGGFNFLGISTANEFYDGLKHESNLPMVFGNQVMKGVEDALIAKDQIKNVGKTVNTAFGQGLTDENGITAAVTTFATNIEAKVKSSFQGKFEAIGKDLTAGLLRGMNEDISKISTTYTNNIENRVRGGLKTHSPSVLFENIGKDLTAGLLQGMSASKDLIKAVYSDTITDMRSYTTSFVQDFITQYEEITNYLVYTLDRQKNDTMNTTNAMSIMYRSMSMQSVSSIQSIIQALNAIPRNITTTHTIITQSVTQSVAGVTAAGSSAKSATSGISSKVKMASGGVVTRPTEALIGEGYYDEAVIPLGNSPQMEDLITKIADAVSQNSNGGTQPPIEVKVIIGDKEWDAFTYKSAQRGEKLVGAQPISTTRR